MARKPNSAARSSRRRQENVFDERSFVDGVFNDEYALVVGSGIVLDRERFPETGGDINQYIINEINNDRRAERNGFVDHTNFTEISRGTPLNEEDPIYTLLTGDYDYDLADISPELTKLLRTKLFRFVLTTTIDGYLEALMRDIWGDELRIVNIEDAASLRDFQTELNKCRVNKYTQPTLFYVFGRVIEGRPKPRGFVETDVDAIKVIEKWMKLDNGKEYIVPFLKSKRMLSLGCKFDDWYFRFFWYIITRGFGYEDRDGNMHTQDNLATIPDDPNLLDYLNRMEVCMHNDVWQFMNHIHSLLTSTDADSPFRSMILDKRREGGIFISYKSCDVLAASELFCKLARERNLNVWFDNISLHGGAEYESEIAAAIKNAKIFIPVLSPSISADLKAKGTALDSFYSKEWRMAAERDDLVVLPVAIGDYNLRGAEHQAFEEIVRRKPSGVDMTHRPSDTDTQERVGFAKLIESINTHLGLND